MNKRLSVGIIGCGKISGAYFKGLKAFPFVEVTACADLDENRARTQAAKYGIPHALPIEQLISSPEVDIVVNLTIPKAHAEVNLAAIAAGKHAYCEKPLASNLEDARRSVEAARAQGVLLGCAPDTFLGGGLQTCRKLIDDGAIGTPVAAAAFMGGHGHESWHPDPEFYYQAGGGPMLDMGPYYVTALVNLLGPVRRVSGSTKASYPTRTITSEPKKGKVIEVQVPTHYAGIMDFTGGTTASIVTSFDMWAHSMPRIEVYGSEGSLSVPDPNNFGGAVRLWRKDKREWEDIELTHSSAIGRGIGVADMAQAILTGRPHRVNGDLAYHVLEVLESFERSSQEERHVQISTTCDRPAALPAGYIPAELT